MLLWTEAAPFGEQRDGWISAPILPLCEELSQPLTFREKDIVGEANCVSPITGGTHLNLGDKYPRGPRGVLRWETWMTTRPQLQSW